MTVEEAKTLIFDRLCREVKKPGENVSLNIDLIREELGIPEGIFGKALNSSVEDESRLYLDPDSRDRTVRLGTAGLQRCQDRRNSLA